MLVPTINRVFKVVGVSCLLWLVSCGGGSSSTGAWTSSLERGTLVSSISADQRLNVCAEFNNWWRRRATKTELCTFTGVIFSTLLPVLFEETGQSTAPICSDLVGECLAGTSSGDDEVSECVVGNVEQLQGCSASVDQMDECLNDSLVLISQILGSLSCDIAGDFQAVKQQFESFANVPPSPACESLKAQCPNVFKEIEVQTPAGS